MSSATPVAAEVPVASDRRMPRLAAVLLTLWAGSLWTICGVVAPTLFAILEDRHTAGMLAAHFFRLEAILGAAAGAALFAVGVARGGSLAGRWPRVLIALAAGAPIVSELALGPLMQSARAAGDMARFGMLHGVAAILFFAACAAALGLVWSVNRRAG